MAIKGVDGPFRRGNRNAYVSFVFGLVVGVALGYMFWGGRVVTETQKDLGTPTTTPEQIPSESQQLVTESEQVSEATKPESQAEESEESEESESTAQRPTAAIAGPLDHLSEEIDLWPSRLMFVAVSGFELDSSAKAFLKTFKPGGVVLLADNLKSPQQVKQLVKQIKEAVGLGQERADLPLVGVFLDTLCSKEEFCQGILKPMQLGESNNPQQSKETGRQLGAICKELGLSVVFGPSFDIHNPSISQQKKESFFGNDHLKVALMALSYAQGIMEEGVVSVATTFPGYGSAQRTTVDPIPTLTNDKSSMAQALFPYMQAAHCGILGILVGHVAVPELDKDAPRRPASLSPVITKAYLRERWAYDGAIVADDLAAEAVLTSRSPERAATEAISAGADALVFLDRDFVRIRSVSKSVEQALTEGRLRKEDVLASIKRLDRWQSWLRSPLALSFDASDLTTGTSTESKGQIASQEVEEAKIEQVQQTVYVVSAGDNLTKIATKHGVTVEQLKKWNNLTDTRLFVGQKLRVAEPKPLADSTAPAMQTDNEAVSELTADDQRSKTVENQSSIETTSEKVAEKPTENVSPAEGEAETSSPRQESEISESTSSGEPEESASQKTTQNQSETIESASGPTVGEGEPTNQPPEEIEYETYMVQPGDTVYGLARRFQVKSEEILRANNMSETDKLLFGRPIKIPRKRDTSNVNE